MATTLLDVAAKSFAPPGSRARRAVDALPDLQTNVGDTERVVCGVLGTFLLARGLSGRSFGVLSALAGGFLVHRGLSGNCMLRQQLGMNLSGPSNSSENKNAVFGAGEGVRVEEMVTVNKPADELFRFWRNYENLPKFMRHLESVTQSGKESTWTATGPLGTRVSWKAETIRENPGEGIAWKSLPGSDVDTAGSVHFKPLPGGRGTEVRVNLKYSPPAGKLGAAIARLFGESPESQVREDLARFKSLMEAGEIATTEGQPSGRK